MIKSMTGFGRCELARNDRKFTVEIKSVNHRYMDVTIKMPKKLNFFRSVERRVGKECRYSESTVAVKYNKEIAAEYMQYLNQMAEDFGLENDIKVSGLSRYPEVFTMEEIAADEEEIWKLLEETIRGAAEQFVQSRVVEGENLRDDLIDKLNGMLVHVDYIEKRSPQIIEEYKQKIYEKVKELLTDAQAEDNRILMEVTLFADKICVDEEMVRLRSHIETTKQTLLEGGSIGRKLDFIAQEMNREANTTLSKANNLDISNHAIELKTEIEKVREQIQNIE